MKTSLETKLKQVPSHEPNSTQILRIWEAVETRSHRQVRQNLFANIFMFASIAALALVIAFQSNMPAATNLQQTIEIKLTAKVQSLATGNNSLVILKTDGTEQEVTSTDYEIEGDILRITLPEGSYRIVFASDKYQNYIATARIN